MQYVHWRLKQSEIHYNQQKSLYLEKFNKQTYWVKCTVCVACMWHSGQQAEFLKLCIQSTCMYVIHWLDSIMTVCKKV